MQTILGSSGQIGQELAKALHKDFTTDIRLVSRNPKKVNANDQLFPANLLDAAQTDRAVAGSEIVYFTAGLPMNSDMWEAQFHIMMTNVINACVAHKAKLVFFDNTYIYAKNSTLQTETSPFEPVDRKAVVRAEMAQLLLDKMATGAIEAVICRAPEFYGPGKTQSITNTMVFNNIKAGKKVRVPLNDQAVRTLIWTPDASRAIALIGNTPDAFSQTWHLPCDEGKTYAEIIALAGKLTHQKIDYTVLKMWQFNLGSWFSKPLKELKELLPRYEEDNLFSSDKFKKRSPEFKVTTIEEGIQEIL